VLDELNKQYPTVIEEGKLISWEIIEVYSVDTDNPLPSQIIEYVVQIQNALNIPLVTH
jgi:hypothetical protein